MTCLSLFWVFFKIGLFTFGGGYAMLPMIEEEVVRRGWADLEELVNFIAVSESTPGPFAVNCATFVGSHTAGFWGALCATLGVVLPSFIIILAVAKCYQKFQKSRVVRGCMSGLRPTVVGLIGAAIVSVGQSTLFDKGVSFTYLSDPTFYISLFIFALMTVLIFKKLHPIAVIGLSAVLGVAAGYTFQLPI